MRWKKKEGWWRWRDADSSRLRPQESDHEMMKNKSTHLHIIQVFGLFSSAHCCVLWLLWSLLNNTEDWKWKLHNFTLSGFLSWDLQSWCEFFSCNNVETRLTSDTSHNSSYIAWKKQQNNNTASCTRNKFNLAQIWGFLMRECVLFSRVFDSLLHTSFLACFTMCSDENDRPDGWKVPKIPHWDRRLKVSDDCATLFLQTIDQWHISDEIEAFSHPKSSSNRNEKFFSAYKRNGEMPHILRDRLKSIQISLYTISPSMPKEKN